MANLRTSLRDYVRKKTMDIMEKRIALAVVVLKAEIQNTIDSYNKGTIKRDKDSSSAPQSKSELLKRTKGALIDTGFYRENWDTSVERNINTIIGRVFTTTEYAIFLENGTSKMEAFRVVQISIVNASNKIEAILKGEMV